MLIRGCYLESSRRKIFRMGSSLDFNEYRKTRNMVYAAISLSSKEKSRYCLPQAGVVAVRQLWHCFTIKQEKVGHAKRMAWNSQFQSKTMLRSYKWREKSKDIKLYRKKFVTLSRICLTGNTASLMWNLCSSEFCSSVDLLCVMLSRCSCHWLAHFGQYKKSQLGHAKQFSGGFVIF